MEINVNLLLDKCNFHCEFRLIFSLILSENVPNVDFREATCKFRINSVLLPPGLQLYATCRLKNNYLDISITVLK